ncbi:MAG: helix-turn-helix transcriptional regulator [Nitrobacter sp.]|uniref:LuxR C-terminal-related transcriptional regulator n=1 Tax=Nitrobacter sp. TaxID=29420 RepID=UPI00387DEF03
MSRQKTSLLDLIYSAIADPGRWPEILTRVADHLGAVGGLLMHIPTAGQGRVIDIYGRLSEEHAAIVREYYPWNPWSKAMLDVPVNRAVIVGSRLKPGEIFKTGFYADVLRPQGLVDIMNVNHAALAQNGGVGGFGFCLSPRGTEQAHHRVRRMQHLVPHLSRALEGTLQLGRLADGRQQLASVLQLMPNPALLINAKGRITFANAAAEVLLRMGDGLSADSEGDLQFTAAFPAESAALTGMLSQALAVAAGTGDTLGEPLRLTRPSGAPPLLVLPVPLPPPAFELWNLLEPARVLVLIIDPSAQRRRKASTVQAAFGLTLAEARVAVLVADGLTGPQTADALGISLSTVKTHLKRCFDKIGIHSQVALARLLATLPIDPTGGWN